jgi:hypothetical protein
LSNREKAYGKNLKLRDLRCNKQLDIYIIRFSGEEKDWLLNNQENTEIWQKNTHKSENQGESSSR